MKLSDHQVWVRHNQYTAFTLRAASKNINHFGHQSAEQQPKTESSQFYAPRAYTASEITEFEQVPVQAIKFNVPKDMVLTDAEKLQLKKNIAETNRLLLARRRFPNPSNVFNASIVEMEGGLWGRGVGAEGHQEFPVCAEKSAICDALTRQSELIMDNPEQNASNDSQLGVAPLRLPKVQRVFHAGDRLKPCGDCLDWMHAGTFFDPTTQIVRLYSRMSENPYSKVSEWVVDIKRAKDFLPLNYGQHISYSPYRVRFIPVEYSDNAKLAIKRLNLNDDKVKRLMEKAQHCYQLFTASSTLNLAPRTQHNMAAAVMLEDGTTASSPFVEIRRGIQIFPELSAFNQAIKKSVNNLEQGLRKVVAIAYFGQNPEFPKPSMLHAFSYPTWGGPDALVMTIKDNRIVVNTISDYLKGRDYYQHITKLSARRQFQLQNEERAREQANQSV